MGGSSEVGHFLRRWKNRIYPCMKTFAREKRSKRKILPASVNSNCFSSQVFWIFSGSLDLIEYSTIS